MSDESGPIHVEIVNIEMVSMRKIVAWKRHKRFVRAISEMVVGSVERCETGGTRTRKSVWTVGK